MVALGLTGAGGKSSGTLKRGSSSGESRAFPREDLLFFEDYPGDFSQASHLQTVKPTRSWFVSSGMLWNAQTSHLARMGPQSLQWFCCGNLDAVKKLFAIVLFNLAHCNLGVTPWLFEVSFYLTSSDFS